MEFRLVLRYYNNKQDFWESKQPLGQIDMDNCLSIEPNVDSMGDLHYVINIWCKDRLYHLCARTENQRLKWLRALRQHRFGNLPENYSTDTSDALKAKKKLRRASTTLASSRIKQLIEKWPRDEYEWTHRLHSTSSSSLSDKSSLSSTETSGSDSGPNDMPTRPCKTIKKHKSFDAGSLRPTDIYSVPVSPPRPLSTNKNYEASLSDPDSTLNVEKESSDEDEYEDMASIVMKLQLRENEDIRTSVTEAINEAEYVTEL